MHLTSNPVDWYAARAAGIVAYLLLTAVLVALHQLTGRHVTMTARRMPPPDATRHGSGLFSP